jgi:opacity protein-like surface antigen
VKVMNRTLAVFAALVATSFGINAFAQEGGSAPSSGFFLEPGVTYELGKTKTNFHDWSSGVLNDSTGEANGLGVVARVGMHINDMFFVALDGRYSMPTFKDSTNNLSSEAEMYSLAPVVGVQMPNIGARFWAGYIAASQLNPKEAGSYDFKFKDGTGFLIGGGFHVAAVSINLEYKNTKFASTDFERLPLGFTATDTSVKAEDQAWVASVTFPIAL